MKKSIPLWIVLFIVFDILIVAGVGGYWLSQKKSTEQTTEKTNQVQNEDYVEKLKQEVVPAKGYTTSLRWGNLGQKLVDSGIIDKKKFEEIFPSEADGKSELKYLLGDWDEKIVINEKNSRFIVNTFWALGLVNKSLVLDEGQMVAGGRDKTKNFASTGGWTIGSRPTMQLYSSKRIIPLSYEQQVQVRQIAENVFRPCCGNSTAFPDCNHGMAALGYIELAIYNNLSEEQIYRDLLAFNSYWFPQTYVEMAVYFEKQGISWSAIDPKLALSKEYSSAMGAVRIKQAIQNVPGLAPAGGSCGV